MDVFWSTFAQFWIVIFIAMGAFYLLHVLLDMGLLLERKWRTSWAQRCCHCSSPGSSAADGTPLLDPEAPRTAGLEHAKGHTRTCSLTCCGVSCQSQKGALLGAPEATEEETAEEELLREEEEDELRESFEDLTADALGLACGQFLFRWLYWCTMLLFLILSPSGSNQWTDSRDGFGGSDAIGVYGPSSPMVLVLFVVVIMPLLWLGLSCARRFERLMNYLQCRFNEYALGQHHAGGLCGFHMPHGGLSLTLI